ncbi:hypothetical protein [Oceanospirillum phage vB_OliS_GJ44]|nr:hypothetical protein [Oceanospirillum phage vB_OliS_GJ44]
MIFDTDGSAHDAVMLAQYKANELQKPYAIVVAPSGSLLAVPVDQNVLPALEVVWPQN